MSGLEVPDGNVITLIGHGEVVGAPWPHTRLVCLGFRLDVCGPTPRTSPQSRSFHTEQINGAQGDPLLALPRDRRNRYLRWRRSLHRLESPRFADKDV